LLLLLLLFLSRWLIIRQEGESRRARKGPLFFRERDAFLRVSDLGMGALWATCLGSSMNTGPFWRQLIFKKSFDCVLLGQCVLVSKFDELATEARLKQQITCRTGATTLGRCASKAQK